MSKWYNMWNSEQLSKSIVCTHYDIWSYGIYYILF